MLWGNHHMRHYSVQAVWVRVFSANLFMLFLLGCQTTPEEEVDTSEAMSNSEGMEGVFSEKVHDAENTESITTVLGEILEETLREPPHASAVSYQELQQLLPRRVNGVRPTITDGQTLAIGSGFSKISGEYKDGEQVVTVTIIDLAAFGKLAAEALSDWVGEDIDRESDRGFERTHIFQNRSKEYPIYEKYHNEHGHEACELHSWVENRFLIAISGDGVPMSMCKSARDKISFRRLERMAEPTAD